MKHHRFANLERPSCSPVTLSFHTALFLGAEAADVPNCTRNDV